MQKIEGDEYEVAKHYNPSRSHSYNLLINRIPYGYFL